jgi:hypothetical protein
MSIKEKSSLQRRGGNACMSVIALIGTGTITVFGFPKTYGMITHVSSSQRLYHRSTYRTYTAMGY